MKEYVAILIGVPEDGYQYLHSIEIPGLHLSIKDIHDRAYIETAIKRLERDNNGNDVEVTWLDSWRLKIGPRSSTGEQVKCDHIVGYFYDGEDL
jgi:hypothetical protein